MACAAALAVQSVIRRENLLANNLEQGAYMFTLLKTRLLSPNTPAAPYVFDIRGGGLWYGIEFAVPSEKLGTKRFAMLVQARCLDNDLVIMGLTGGATMEGKSGDHCMLSPAYNVNRNEVGLPKALAPRMLFIESALALYVILQIEKIVDIFVQSVEEIVRETGL